MLYLLKILALFLAMPAFCADAGDINTSGLIRIAIAHNAKKASMDIRGRTRIVDMSSGDQKSVAEQISFQVTAAPEGKPGVNIGPYTLGSMVRITPLEGEDRLKINNRSYRGSILVKANKDQTITVIEELGLEEYLYGVLPLEMGNSWPLEALKAQAVAARTYALGNMNRFGEMGFDLWSDQRSQMYGGAGVSAPRVVEAVKATDSEVLTYKGHLVPAFYHANCGGRTARPPWDMEYTRTLSGVSCRYCSNSGNYRWQTLIGEAKILAFLDNYGFTPGSLKAIRIAERDRSGRATVLKFMGPRTGKAIDIKDFRRAIGSTEFRSSFIIRIVKHKNGFEFVGRGFGHGVGMCQDGARTMAEKKQNYRQILKYYYPGAQITTLQQ